MIGTIVNTLAIMAGTLIGLIFSRVIAGKISDTLVHAIAFAVILIGLIWA
jgi:uncharacterized membrane protein YqgA involved in biofilm formation